jgi:hypothetical protein
MMLALPVPFVLPGRAPEAFQPETMEVGMGKDASRRCRNGRLAPDLPRLLANEKLIPETRFDPRE